MTGFEAHAHASQPDAAHYGSQAALAALRVHFGYESFRPGQAELIEAIASNRDVLGVMPTGSGKSVCYQIPALLLHGITIVISPLISLMRDQVDGANEIGIPAAFINTTQTMDEQEQVLDAAYAGKVKLLYVAPERLETPRFRNFAARADIALIAVDEAHCVSQWARTSARRIWASANSSHPSPTAPPWPRSPPPRPNACAATSCNCWACATRSCW